MQTRIDAWVEGIAEPQHEHALDILWTQRGLVPPCMRKGVVTR